VIIATVRGEPVVFSGGVISEGAPSPFRKPATAVRGVERTEGGTPVNERVQVKVAPGTGEHFRAVVRKLGGSIDVDDGED
jgi:hypothetical protein